MKMLPSPGMNIKANRKDGRVFAGTIENVKYVGGRTMVIVKTIDGFKSVYLDDCENYTLCDYSTAYNGPAMQSYSTDYDAMMLAHGR